MSVVEFSNLSQANFLKVPRTLNCNGSARPFPGKITCPICYKRKGCFKCGFGTIGGNCVNDVNSILSEYCGKVIAQSSGEFTSWETAKQSKAWGEFKQHLDSEHRDDSRQLECPKCYIPVNTFEALFQHSFRLMEIGYLCLKCHYPFHIQNVNSICAHFRTKHDADMKTFKVLSFDQWIAATNAVLIEGGITLGRGVLGESNVYEGKDCELNGVSEHSSPRTPECNKVVPLKKFYTLNPQKGEYVCMTCDKKFNSLNLFKSHYKSAHAYVNCPKCSQLFRCQRYLRNHLKISCPSAKQDALSAAKSKFGNSGNLAVSSKMCSYKPAAPRNCNKHKVSIDLKAAKRASRLTHFDWRPTQISAGCSGGVDCSPAFDRSLFHSCERGEEKVKIEPFDPSYADLDISNDLSHEEINNCKPDLNHPCKLSLQKLYIKTAVEDLGCDSSDMSEFNNRVETEPAGTAGNGTVSVADAILGESIVNPVNMDIKAEMKVEIDDIF